MRRLSFLLAVVALVGCSEKSAELTLGPTDTDIVGNYALTRSNGRSLPIIARLTVEEQWDLTADRIVIAPDNTWIETTTYRVVSFTTGQVTTQESVSSGTYSVANGQINFVMKVGGSFTFTGSVTGNVLSLLYNGGHFQYSR